MKRVLSKISVTLTELSTSGPAIMMLSAFLFSVLGFIIKVLGPSFRVWDIAVYRFGGSALLLLILFGRRTNLFKSENPGLLLMRGVFGSISFICIIYAIRIIPLSTAMVVFYSFPAFAAAFSPWFFRDRISVAEILCIVTAFIGVSVLMGFQLNGGLWGQLMALIGAVFAALTISFVKKLRENHGPVIIYFHLCWIGTAVAFGPYISDPRIPHTALDWVLVGGIISISITAQLLMHHGFRYCRSWEGGLLMSSELIYAAVFGIVFLSEPASWGFWAGGAMIIGSSIMLSLSKAKVNVKSKIPNRF